MRVSLFITCYNDTLFPADRQSCRASARAARAHHRFPPRPDLLRPDALEHWLPREAVPFIRHFVDVFRDAEAICIPSSSCVAMIRDHYDKAAIGLGDQAFIADVEALLPRVYEFSEFLVNKLGVDDVGARIRIA